MSQKINECLAGALLPSQGNTQGLFSTTCSSYASIMNMYTTPRFWPATPYSVDISVDCTVSRTSWSWGLRWDDADANNTQEHSSSSTCARMANAATLFHFRFLMHHETYVCYWAFLCSCAWFCSSIIKTIPGLIVSSHPKNVTTWWHRQSSQVKKKEKYQRHYLGHFTIALIMFNVYTVQYSYCT